MPGPGWLQSSTTAAAVSARTTAAGKGSDRLGASPADVLTLASPGQRCVSVAGSFPDPHAAGHGNACHWRCAHPTRARRRVTVRA
jgi:hypothetical protein